MPRLRAVPLILLLLVAACFSPKVPECAFRCGTGELQCPPDQLCLGDGFCHRPGAAPTCGASPEAGIPDSSIVLDGPIIDAPITIDAQAHPDAPPPVDASAIDAPAPADARPADARPADARPPDAMLMIDAPPPPDANICSANTCSDPRTCGFVSNCECGLCGADDAWCGQNCGPAICENNNCCLPENSPCDVGLGQCCAGLTCALLICVTL